MVFLKTQLVGTTTSHYVPVEAPEPLMERADLLIENLEQAEYEYELLIEEAESKQRLGTWRSCAGRAGWS